jgi:glycosyltransferase involved in cell wall biosynthesis
MRRGGAERQTLTIMVRMNRAEWSPMLVTVDGEGPYYDAAIEAGIDSVCLGVHGRFPIRAFLRLVRLLRAGDTQMLVASGFSAGVLGRIAAVAAGVPAVVVVEHQAGDLGWGWARTTIDRLLGHVTDAYVAVCKSQLKYLWEEKRLPRGKTCVIYNGIEPPDAPGPESRSRARDILGLGSDEFVVGIVAALRPEKDHLNFLRAAAELRGAHPNSRYVVVGDGPMRPRIEAAIHELGLGGAVVLTGDRSDVRDLVPAFDVFTLSSYTVEAFPISALEAMSAGVPVVATNVGGLGEMLRDGIEGRLVEPRDPAALAGAWNELVDDAARTTMGGAASLRVRELFTAERMTTAYEELFTGLLKRSHRRLTDKV